MRSTRSSSLTRALCLAFSLASHVRGCADDPTVADKCKEWASQGECEANPTYDQRVELAISC
jgi:hypothetical protein